MTADTFANNTTDAKAGATSTPIDIPAALSPADTPKGSLPVPNVPDISAFNMSGDMRITSNNLALLQRAGEETQAIMQKYTAAMREMQVRLEILDQDLNLKKQRNPIHHIESRIKTPSSIYDKIIRYGYEPTLENMERYILDIAGIRVICPYIQDVYSIFQLLNRQDDLEIVKVKDYIATPKENGYRSLHVIVRIPVYFMEKKESIPVEIQLRTLAMDFWASLEHDLKYKAVSEVAGLDASAELKECSQMIEEAELRMQVLARALEPED